MSPITLQNVTTSQLQQMLETYLAMPNAFGKRRRVTNKVNIHSSWRNFEKYMATANRDATDEMILGSFIREYEQDRFLRTGRHLEESTKRTTLAIVLGVLRFAGVVDKETGRKMLSKMKMPPLNWSEKGLSRDDCDAACSLILKRLIDARQNFSVIDDTYKLFVFNQVRLFVMFHVAVLTGMRRAEMIRELSVRGVELKDDTLVLRYVPAKTSVPERTHELPLSIKAFGNGGSELRQWVEMYHEMRSRPKICDEGTYFCRHTGKMLEMNDFWKELRQLGDEIGVVISPHTLRHTCGTILTNEAGVHVASAVLGHSALSRTQAYVRKPGKEKITESYKSIFK